MKIKIGGLVENPDLTLYRLTSVYDEPGAAGEILQAFADNKVNLEYLTESSTVKGYAVMAICVNIRMAAVIDRIIYSDKKYSESLNIKKEEHVSVIGIYGPHFKEKPQLAAIFCQTLGKADINILGLSSSISSISAIIANHELEAARTSLLKVFELP
jgi:aspartokinase